MKWDHKTKDTRIISRRRVRNGLVIILIGVVAIGWLKYNQAPVTGTIIQTDVLAAEDPLEVKNSHFKGSYVSFDYPASYGTVQSNVPSGRIAEQYSLSARLENLESRRISVTVYKVSGSDAMDEDSAYRFRADDPKTYLQESVTVNGRSIKKFSKLDYAEVTYFVPDGAYYAIVSATSTRSGGDFITDAAAVVSSFNF